MIDDVKAAIDAQLLRLTSDNPTVRLAAVGALGQIATNHAIPLPPIIERLADAEDSVRDAARDVLREMGERAFEALITHLNEADNTTIRGACADLLGDSGDESVRPPLLIAFRGDDSRWVRSRAEAALKRLPGGAPAPFPQVGVDDVPPRNFSKTADALQHLRQSQADWSGLMSKPESPVPDSPANDAPPTQEADYTPEQIQALLDQLDLRLLNGDISEATYERLYARWSARLSGK